MGRGDATSELDVASQVEPIRDIVKIALCLGVGREALAPAPFLQQFLRERIAYE
jgi:hypothetical protein